MIDMSKLTEKEKEVVEKAKLLNSKIEEVLKDARKIKDPIGVFIIRFNKDGSFASTIGFVQLSALGNALIWVLKHYGVNVVPFWVDKDNTDIPMVDKDIPVGS